MPSHLYENKLKLLLIEAMMNQLFKTEIRKIAPLTDADCDLFTDQLKTHVIPKGNYFISEGQISRDIGFIVSGVFRMYYLLDGKEINTHFFFEREFVVAYESFLMQAPTKYYIEALEDSEIITLSHQHLERAYEASHAWERFGRKVSELCYILSIQRAESFMCKTAEERYRELNETQPHLFARIPLYHLASYLGIERESLSRLRKKMLR